VLVRNAPADLFGSIHTYRVTGVRGAEAELLAQVAREAGLTAHAHPSPQAALDAAARTGRNVLAVGTLYTLAALRTHWEVENRR
jgi:folylpolyglutamate synthase/dihydropteroate synthase